MEVLPMAEDNITRLATPSPIPDDGPWPCMVTLVRSDKELVAVGATDSDDAARQAVILILQVDGGLKIGDVIQISRI
jgi:hypothetical protein